jgi:pimeloyl-ACP methyl ester carboxylesterase
VAIATAIAHPPAVRSLVLVGSVRPGESLGFVDRMLASPGLGEALAAMTIGATAVVLGNRRVRDLVERRFDGRTRDAVHALEGVTGARTRAPVWRSFVSEQRRLFDELDTLTPSLGEISVPTVVLSGDADRIVPAEVGERLAESIPGAVHRVVPDARHLLAFDHPDEIVAAVSEAESRADEPAG